MAGYPRITGNVGGTNENRYDLINNLDNSPDVYVFKNPITEIQEAYMIVIVKNTSTSVDLDVSNIASQSNFTEQNGFYLNPTVNSVTGNGSTSIPFLGGWDINEARLNKIKSTPSQVIGSTTNTSNADAAVGFIGVKTNTPITDSGDGSFAGNDGIEFNDNSTNIVPIYSTSYVISNPIPPGRYAAFIVRYAPISAKNAFTAILKVSNNATDFFIRFGASAVNAVSYFGREANVSRSGTTVSIEITDNNILNQGVLDLGLWPTLTGANKNLDKDLISKYVQFDDYSVQSGTYSYDYNKISTGSDIIKSSNGKIDDLLTNSFGAGQEIFGILREDSEAINTTSNYQDNLIYTDVSVGVNRSQLDGTNIALMKSFELKESITDDKISSLIKDGTHITPSIRKENDDTQKYSGANRHTTEDIARRKRNYRIGKIINDLDLSQVIGTNKYLYFSVTLGFYSVLSMKSDQTSKHAQLLASNASESLDTFINVDLTTLSDLHAPTFVSTRSDGGGHMDRKSICQLNVHLRYNNFNGSDNYAIPNFNVKEAFGLNGRYFSLQKPVKYITGSDYTGFQETDFSSGTNANTTFTGFNTAAKNGTLLGLQYDLQTKTEGGNSLVLDHLYSTEGPTT